jgi:hypothetical protein
MLNNEDRDEMITNCRTNKRRTSRVYIPEREHMMREQTMNNETRARSQVT